MGIGVGTMYSYLHNGLGDSQYLVIGWVILVGVIGLMWLGRNW